MVSGGLGCIKKLERKQILRAGFFYFPPARAAEAYLGSHPSTQALESAGMD